jgi:prepilin-type N-terminal cleavage/methylation domain-containing protein
MAFTHRRTKSRAVRLGSRAVRRSFSGSGFSLIETLLVIAILAIVAGIAIPVSNTVIGQGKADSATSVTLAALQEARARAIAERRNFRLEFCTLPTPPCEPAAEGVTPNVILVSREELAGAPPTVISTTVLEGGQGFRLLEGVTPLDEFGADGEIHFTGAPGPVRFTTDGSLIDSTGDPVNGTIHLANLVDVSSVRAVTILGATGLMQTWKWTGSQWHE